MSKIITIIKSGTLILFLFIAAGCSSSSYSNRYNKPESKDTPVETKQNRFSSKDDPNPTVEKKESYKNPGSIKEFDEEPIEDYPVDKDAFVKNFKHLEKLSSALTNREKILFEVVKYLDTPYQYGGQDLNGIDCSAFTQNIMSNTVGLNLPRTASEQYKVGNTVSKSSLQFGDLVFFNTRRESYPGHVGIYIGDDMFAHASSSLGVTISSMKSTYFKERFINGKRIDNISGQ